MVTGRWSAWAVLVVAVLASGAVIGLGGAIRISNDPTAGLPSSAQSTQVAKLQQQLPSADVSPALVVYSRTGGTLSGSDLKAVDRQQPALARLAQGGRVSPPQVSPDQSVALVVVPLPANVPSGQTSDSVSSIRDVVRTGLPAGMLAQVSGGAGFTADLSAAFNGANVRLLLVTAGVVALLLLVTYRSPILWLVPLAVTGLAAQVATALIAVLSRHSGLAIDESVTGIVEVLVFGAGTDYALLLIARYREELREIPDRRDAMRRAMRAAAPAISASGATVMLALLTLLFASLGGDKAIGVAGAIGIGTALLFGLLVLPAALVLCPRGVFWPLVPRADEAGRRANAEEGRVWRRVGRATARRPWTVIVSSVFLLGLLAAGVTSTTLGLSQVDTFRTSAESVDGLRTLSRAFPAGAADPVAVVTKPAAVDEVIQAAKSVPGVATVSRGESTNTLAQVNVTLDATPDSGASFDAVRALRTAVGQVPDAHALVGGTIATNLDTRSAAVRDLKVIAPMILAVVFLVLVVLLRALVAPIVLIATVVLSFFAALGAASLAFTYVFDYPGLGDQVPLLSFLFLVALGVDYNIFLITRTQQEARTHGTREGIIVALAVTGGVITSAGILLAAVFTVLGVLPVTVLTEVGIIVGLGVLLDTLLVRTVLVPALVHVLGDRFWLPGTISGPASHAGEPGGSSASEVAAGSTT